MSAIYEIFNETFDATYQEQSVAKVPSCPVVLDRSRSRRQTAVQSVDSSRFGNDELG